MLKEGYTSLTRVQELSIPKVLSGKHVVIVAPTGSGKTEAALFPILSEMVRRGYTRRISALYVTPLRALNRDILRRIKSISVRLGIEVSVRHGDTPSSLRRAMSLQPPHILITTPETLSYILVNPRLREALKSVRWVVVDELHELIESKRGSQVALNLERLEELAGRFQRIGLSASIGDVEAAKRFLAYGRAVEEVVIEGVRDMDVRLVMGYYSVDPSEKFNTLAELIRRHRTTIVFTNTRDEAELIGRRLAELGLDARVHHGSLSRDVREEVERLLRDGLVPCVVATSSLELGIDVGSVEAVIQVSSPRQVLKLVQRIGRARHGPGKRAIGYIVADDVLDDIVESAVIVRRATEGLIEKPRLYERPYDVLLHALVGMGLEGGYSVDRAFRVVTRSYPYAQLTYEEFRRLVDKAVEFGYLRLDERGELRSTGRGRLYYMTTTTIVDMASYEVVDTLTGRRIGNLDEEFVVDLEDGAKLVLSGRLWSIVTVDSEAKRVYVEELPEGEALVPSWTGETIPVDYKVSREACGLLRLVAATGRLPPQYASFMSSEAAGYVERVVEEHVRAGHPLPSDRAVVVEYVDGDRPLLVVMSCLGTRGNRGLAYLLLREIGLRYGVSPAYKVDPYRVIIELPYRLPPREILDATTSALTAERPLEALVESMRRSRLFDLLVFNVGRRLGLIPEDADPRTVRAIVTGLRSDDVVSAEAVREGLTRYVDPGVVLGLVEGIRRGTVRVLPEVLPRPSPLVSEGLKYAKAYDRVREGTIPRRMIAELVRRRILGKEVLLVCLHCGHSWVIRVAELGSRINCGRCGYGLIGVSKVVDEDVVRVVRKAIKLGSGYKFGLSKEEEEVFEKLMSSAMLVLDYGRKAVEALVAHGVGPETAKRVLQYEGDDFYVKLYELEKQYLRTRRFWD